MSAINSADSFALYGAFAGVAAITTALQAAVALQPLSQADDVGQRKRSSSPGEQPYSNAVTDAGTYIRGSILLNIGAIVVNVAVLITWGYLIFSVVPKKHWYLELPFLAVSGAALYLVVIAVVGIVRLCGER
jgi:hypothetical protein